MLCQFTASDGMQMKQPTSNQAALRAIERSVSTISTKIGYTFTLKLNRFPALFELDFFLDSGGGLRKTGFPLKLIYPLLRDKVQL